MLTKKLIAGAAVMLAAASVGFAQSPRAEGSQIASRWSNGLSANDAHIVAKIVRGMGNQDRFMIYTAIVRNREASHDIFKGEPLATDKVLANVRVRMSTEESSLWTKTWSHMNSWDRQAMVGVLRDDLAQR
jgi:hypothetical protein